MTEMLPQDGLALVLIVFVLGLKHGMDPDHLTTIDGLTRFNVQSRPHLARWSGCLFSLGHGLVVTLVAGVAGVAMTDGSPPGWLEHLGASISIVFLLALGVANLWAVFRTPGHQVVRPAGFKGRWLGRLVGTGHPMVIASIGAAFALSFDTWSQAALFSLTARHVAGWGLSVALGLVFTLGMMLADGANGLWVAPLLRRADRQALIASRVMSVTIAVLSLAIAGVGLARYVAPGIASMPEGAAPILGLGVAITLAASFALAMRLSRPAPGRL